MNVRWRRVLLWSMLAAVVLVGLVYAFRPQPVPVDLATVDRGAMVVTVDEEGETRVEDVFVLSAPVTGRALRIDAEVGDEVIADETVIAQIEPIDPAFLDVRSEAQARAAVRAAEAARNLAQAQLEQAEAELDFARAELTRARRLSTRSTISESALDEAERAFRTRKAALATAKAELEMREYELERARAQLVSPAQTRARRPDCECVPIRAPVTGRILRVLHESEGVVQAGDALAEIGDPADLEIVVDLLSSDAVKVQAGQRVIVDDWGGEDSLNGRVQRVEPYGFTKISALGIEEQRVNVIVELTDPRDRWERLGHGYRVEVRIVLWEADDVLKLPVSALFRQNGDWAVFVEDDGRARLRRLELGRRTDLEAQVLGGLSEGDRVVVHPSDRVLDGTRIVRRS